MKVNQSAPSTCLIIPLHNGGEAFEHCLLSLAGLNPKPDEILIVDDGGSDDSAYRAQAAGYRVIRREQPGGPAQARNVAAARTQADLLVFLDADTSAPPNYISEAVQMLSQDSGLAAVIGSYDDSPGHPGFFSQYRNLLHHYTHQTSSEQAVTFWGACGAIWRDVYVEFGGFDESLRYLEDIEFGMRLKRAGHRIRLAKHWQVKHHKAYNAFSLIHNDLIQRALPWTRLALGGYGLINDLNTKISKRICVALSLLLPLLALAGFIQPGAWLGLGLAFLLLLSINWNFYIFLVKKRSLSFAILAVFWHWVYYISSGVGLVLGVGEYCLNSVRGRFTGQELS